MDLNIMFILKMKKEKFLQRQSQNMRFIIKFVH